MEKLPKKAPPLLANPTISTEDSTNGTLLLPPVSPIMNPAHSRLRIPPVHADPAIIFRVMQNGVLWKLHSVVVMRQQPLDGDVLQPLLILPMELDGLPSRQLLSKTNSDSHLQAAALAAPATVVATVRAIGPHPSTLRVLPILGVGTCILPLPQSVALTMISRTPFLSAVSRINSTKFPQLLTFTNFPIQSPHQMYICNTSRG